ncbi:MAG: hypothetical protein E7359_04090 [Clostridiales bacterium]|nr:hypothetical protein [Clostridiales bacterium]
MKRFKNDWILYLIISILSIALGIVLIVNNYKIGLDILNIVIAVLLLVYLGLVVVPVLRRKTGSIQVLTIVELVIICIIAIGLVLQQFKVFNIVGSCKIIGLVLWIRAVVELFRAYFYRGKESSFKYPMWYFCVILLLITLGTYMFAAPFFTDTQVVLTLAISLFILAAILIILSIIFIPKSKKKKTNKKSKKS